MYRCNAQEISSASPRLIKLWEIMENFKPLVNRMRLLAELRGICAVSTDTLDEWTFKGLIKAMEGLHGELNYFGLDAALDRFEVSESLRDPMSAHDAHNSTVEEQLRGLIEAMIGQLGRRYYIPIAAADADFYSKPESKFPTSLRQFPSIAEDVKEACRCYALERYTACVFHAMGILQVGLYALADECKVAFPFKIELADWENVIEGIESKITEMRKGSKSDQKDADLKFYSSLAVQFRYFKNAWRNHVAHLREEYDKDQAHSILIHVRDFMEQAATRLKEIGL